MVEGRTLILEERQEYTLTGNLPPKKTILEDLKYSIEPELELEDIESGEGIFGDEMKKIIKDWHISKVDIRNLETLDNIISCDVSIYINYQVNDKKRYAKKIMEEESITFYVAGRTAQDMDYAEYDQSEIKVFIW